MQLRCRLRNGDVVEIMTQAGHLPSKDWLGLVKTSRARNKIKHVINTTERAKAIEIGEKYLEREARRLGVGLVKVLKTQFEAVASDYGCSKMEDLYAALGYREIFRPTRFCRSWSRRLAPAEPPPAPEPPSPSTLCP